MGKKYQAPPKAEPATLYRSAGLVTVHAAAVAFADRPKLEVFTAASADAVTAALCERLPQYAAEYAAIPAARPLLDQLRRLLHDNTPTSRDAAVDLFFEEIARLDGDDMGDRLTRSVQTLTIL